MFNNLYNILLYKTLYNVIVFNALDRILITKNYFTLQFTIY